MKQCKLFSQSLHYNHISIYKKKDFQAFITVEINGASSRKLLKISGTRFLERLPELVPKITKNFKRFQKISQDHWDTLKSVEILEVLNL